MPDTSGHPGGPKGRVTIFRQAALVLMRVAVGVHFLYAGIAGLSGTGWRAADLLERGWWAFAPVFRWIASSPALAGAVDFLAAAGSILVGAALVLGCFTPVAAGAGVLLFLVYHVAHPPFVGLALFAVMALPDGTVLGLDRLIARVRDRRRAASAGGGDEPKADVAKPAGPVESRATAERASLGRREILAGLASVPFLGAFLVAVLKGGGWRSHEEERLKEALAGAGGVPPDGKAPAAAGADGEGAAAEIEPDAVTSATIKTFQFPTLKSLNGQIPHAKIGDLDLSRLILGGNLIGGWAHARDLIYVSRLVKAYHHDWKVFETFRLAENCGVNAILTNPVLCGVINEYWRRGIGKIRFISDCGGSNLLDMVKKSIDSGAAACYVQGGTADGLVRQGKIDQIERALDLTWVNGVTAGIGAHSIETVKACVKYGLEPDFWMKTLHHHDYWSAKPKQQHDNMWCYDPAETIAFMKGLEQPWIAFKTLAAGAIDPRNGFPYAFRNGADFICVGMYDFQLVEDVNIALKVLGGKLERERPWRA